MWNDANAYYYAAVEYKIVFEDASSDTTTAAYRFIKGVNQITEKDSFLNRGIHFHLYKPFNKSAFLTYFKGYPFSIAMFGNDPYLEVDEINSLAKFIDYGTALPSVNPSSHAYTTDDGVQRLIISDGQSEWAEITDEYHVIRVGVYGQEIRLKSVDECGLYFKWHNDYGGWDYWLFERNHTKTQKDKQIGQIVQDYDNLPDTDSPVESTGKTSESSIKIYANGLKSYDIERVLGIARAPKVYMYLGEKGEQNGNWLEVDVSGQSTEYRATAAKSAMAFKVTIPSTYTLSL